MRKAFAILGSIACIMLITFISWCWRDNTETATWPVVRELWWWFVAQLPSTFDRVPVGLVENRQIVNQLLSSRKETTQPTEENPQPAFDPNLVVTTSRISSELTSKEYARGSLQKVINDVSWTQVDSRSTRSIQCWESSIDAERVELTVSDSYYAWADTYYLSQLYIVKDGKGYLISMASTDQNTNQNRFDSVVDSLQCK